MVMNKTLDLYVLQDEMIGGMEEPTKVVAKEEKPGVEEVKHPVV